MKTLRVELGARSYPIYIGSGLLGQASLIAPHVAGRQVLVVTNEMVAPLYLERTLTALQGFQTDALVLPDGEAYKNLDTLNLIFDRLLQKRFDRRCTLVALGGGVVGDITGFAAASYQRGVAFIQVPTTLLSQVDSSVGGKTGVNHPLGKNMIGAFHQPRCVVADMKTLDTLADRELRAGLAEVIKYGLINDPEFFTWLEENMTALLNRDVAALAYAVERSCRDKAAIVAQDEHEEGARALLNLGHTFGHAIETGMGYGVWLHGEAVATGMVMAAQLSSRMGWLKESEERRVIALIEKAGLPIKAPKELSARKFADLMAVDKKVQDGKLRLVLMHGIGNSIITGEVGSEPILATIEAHHKG
jgi:3-dehydroquinate synthase